MRIFLRHSPFFHYLYIFPASLYPRQLPPPFSFPSPASLPSLVPSSLAPRWLVIVRFFSLSLTIFISHFILLSAFFSSLIYFPLFLPHYIFFFFPLLNSPPQFISFLIFPQTTISNIIPPFFHFFSIFFLFHFSLDLFSSLLPFFSSFTHDLPFLIFPSISSFHFSSFFSSTF